MSRYEDRTKDELLELARDRDIPGRSGMTKDELISALRGEVLEEEVVVEEVYVEDGPPAGDLQRAEYYRALYEDSDDPSDYAAWKQAEQAHLS
jgi:hypothetical protein